MGRALPRWPPLIYLADHGGGLKGSLGLGVDRFLDQFVLAIESSIIVPSIDSLDLSRKDRVRADSSADSSVALSVSNPIT